MNLPPDTHVCAFCGPDGVISFSEEERIPGLVRLASGPLEQIQPVIEAIADRGEGGALLVPGVPSAFNFVAATRAVEQFGHAFYDKRCEQ